MDPNRTKTNKSNSTKKYNALRAFPMHYLVVSLVFESGILDKL